MAHRGFTDSQIEAFMWVMKTSSATEAADKMLISQPAVSRLIKQLESRLGFALFERQNNRLLPTRRGSLFYDEVQRVYLGLSHLRQFAHRLRDQAAGQLRIVTMPSFSMSLIPDAAAQLAEPRPDLEISLYCYRSSQIPDDMVAQRFDFGITTDLRPDPRYQSFFYSLPGVCLIPAAHPLAEKAVIDIDDFENETLICGEPNEQGRSLLTQLMMENHITPRKIWTVSLSEMALKLVENGTGLSVVNTVSACEAQRAGIVVRPLSFEVRYDFQIILPLAKNIEPAINALNNQLVSFVEAKIQASLEVLSRADKEKLN
ncbi:LysR substrate-binding domain-containing protein [Vibrio sp. CAU 1672]|uniref:LysR substrate-binding domain-containing protein n=1 Tax=Vibrio sp. CAU 1672 TaxID=3032594 RepID=UPI0023DA25F5|nr:LysR substrate-binding domain-containing protein [Vibrio sp. CAU 1672]MDF2152516.1 LysR substrate-binding domain-containing protein [Vibrio sp. CAU 1672]